MIAPPEHTSGLIRLLLEGDSGDVFSTVAAVLAGYSSFLRLLVLGQRHEARVCLVKLAHSKLERGYSLDLLL